MKIIYRHRLEVPMGYLEQFLLRYLGLLEKTIDVKIIVSGTMLCEFHPVSTVNAVS